MLLEFSCSNHKSIRKEILFSAMAGTDDAHDDKTIRFGNYRILRSGLIYGPNGSGKSNLIDTILFVKRLVVESVGYPLGHGIRQITHKLEPADSESSYAMQFVANGIRYMYGFTLKNLLVADEYLYYVPNGRQIRIFERSGADFAAGSRFGGKLSACRNVVNSNRLLLSCAATYSKVAEIIAAYKFFLRDLQVYSHLNQNRWTQYSLYRIGSNSEIRRAVIGFLRDLGTGIRDIEVKIDRKKLEMADLPDFFGEFPNMLLQKDVDAISARVVYDQFSTDLMREESDGIRKLMALIYPLTDLSSGSKALICDELEASLHESVLHNLVKFVMNLPEGNTSQLFFTTHDTTLLNSDIFRRDQIWFTEMTNDRSTDLYSLAELKDVRKNENFARCYMLGKYGAVPMQDPDFAKYSSFL